jgi:hypothetical protein
MPKINRQFHLEVTVEQFLQACTPTEIKELDILLASPKYQQILSEGERKTYVNPYSDINSFGNDEEADDLPF